MKDDKSLINRFRHGDRGALREIYEKYERYLLTLAVGLLLNEDDARDVVHDVFVRFAQSDRRFKQNGSLKSYLATSVVNRVRDRFRKKQQRQKVGLDEIGEISGDDDDRPEAILICNEELQQMRSALEKLPLEQREVIIMHLNGRMTFREIARLQGVSTSTALGRYRYGLDKLREIIYGEVKK